MIPNIINFQVSLLQNGDMYKILDMQSYKTDNVMSIYSPRVEVELKYPMNICMIFYHFLQYEASEIADGQDTRESYCKPVCLHEVFPEMVQQDHYLTEIIIKVKHLSRNQTLPQITQIRTFFRLIIREDFPVMVSFTSHRSNWRERQRRREALTGSGGGVDSSICNKTEQNISVLVFSFYFFQKNDILLYFNFSFRFSNQTKHQMVIII